MEDWPIWLSLIVALLCALYALLWFLLPICVYYIYSRTWLTYLEAKKIRELLERAEAGRSTARLPAARPKEDTGSRPGRGV